MNYKFAALFCRADSAYKKRKEWDVYDAERDATKYNGTLPVAVHPPCRAWGRLSHLAFRDGTPPEKIQAEKDLALFAIQKVRECGGVLEHPSGSRLWQILPDAGELPDSYGGFTIEIDQYNFGHVAHKKTKLYICGTKTIPPLPPKDESIHLCEKGKRRSICGNVKGTTRCTQYQREYTPENLIDYIELILDSITKKG